jgi:hypothetical protein
MSASVVDDDAAFVPHAPRRTTNASDRRIAAIFAALVDARKL